MDYTDGIINENVFPGDDDLCLLTDAIPRHLALLFSIEVADWLRTVVEEIVDLVHGVFEAE